MRIGSGEDRDQATPCAHEGIEPGECLGTQKRSCGVDEGDHPHALNIACGERDRPVELPSGSASARKLATAAGIDACR